MPRVIGLDTASNRWHLVRDDGLRWRCLIKDDKMSASDRRQRLYREARTAFAMQPSGTWIFAEEPIYVQNGRTSRVLAGAAYVIEAASYECDVFWAWVEISKWKEVVGNGNASKDRVKAWVLEHLDVGLTEDDDQDYFDAAAIGEWGRRELTKTGVIVAV